MLVHAHAYPDLTALEADLGQDQVTVRYREGGQRKEVWTSVSSSSRTMRVVYRAFIEVSEHDYSGGEDGENVPTPIMIPIEDVIEVEVDSYEETGHDALGPDYDFIPFSRWLLDRWKKLRRLALD